MRAYSIPKRIKYIPFLVLLLAISSCSTIQKVISFDNTRSLSDDQVLYHKNTVQLSSTENIRKEVDLQKDLEQQTTPRLNKKALNLFKTRLFIHNFLKGESGIDKLLYESFGEAPVLFDTLDLDRSVNRIKSRLVSKGYFNHEVDYDYTIEEKRASVKFYVEVDNRYYIKDIILPSGESEIAQVINKEWASGDQNKFKAFDEDKLIKEKERLTTEMRNLGYFDFRQEYIKFRVDSFTNYKLLNLYVDVDSLAGTEPHKKYVVDDIYIVPDFNVEGSRGLNGDTILVDGLYHYITTQNKFRPRSLTRLVKMEKGKPYSEKDYRLTINQFLELGVFRFVNIRFDKVGDNRLKAYILLTPSDRWAATAEIEAHTRGGGSILNSNAGNAVKATLKNNNFFGGGELMSLSVPLATEYFFDGDRETQFLTAIDFSPELSFKFPNLLVPFRYDQSLSGNRPITNFSTALQRVKQRGRYESAEFEFGFGYDWRPSAKWRFIIRPVDIRFFRVWDETPTFEAELDANPRLERIFVDANIIGGVYSAIYNSQNFKRPSDFVFFRANVEFAGNFLKGIETITGNDLEIFGLPFSQYLRLEGDLRYYWQVNRNNLIVGRLYGGYGLPIQNSNENPYTKQFFAGGSSNLRAFRIRGLGPGTTPFDVDDPLGFERFGDIKFTANLEYRFPIVTVFKGALFTDVGNIWIRNDQDDVLRPGEYLNLSRSFNELAVGSGFGLRMDFGYFIFRLDTAIPLRGSSFVNPNLHEFRWLYDEIDFLDKEWRKQNLRFNLGIGYPF